MNGGNAVQVEVAHFNGRDSMYPIHKSAFLNPIVDTLFYQAGHNIDAPSLNYGYVSYTIHSCRSACFNVQWFLFPCHCERAIFSFASTSSPFPLQLMAPQ